MFAWCSCFSRVPRREGRGAGRGVIDAPYLFVGLDLLEFHAFVFQFLYKGHLGREQEGEGIALAPVPVDREIRVVWEGLLGLLGLIGLLGFIKVIRLVELVV